MLFFVGLGIDGVNGISIAAIEALQKCDTVCIEVFTSYISEEQIKELETLVKTQVTVVPRWYIEDGREILEKAKTQRIAIVTYGDPMIATTLIELRTRAARSSIGTRIFHSASGILSLVGESGLQFYKFGRTTTIMSEAQSALSVYNAVYENLSDGNHSLILTEYNNNGKLPYFLNPRQAFSMLVEVESDQRLGVFVPSTFVIVASRIGQSSQKFTAGTLELVQSREFEAGPHSIIIPGPLHFVEQDSLESVAECLAPVSNNATTLKVTAQVMLERYAPKAREAVKNMRKYLSENGEKENAGMFEVIDNADYYISDAERFMRQRKPELAVLSIGYAEGLIDSIRFQKGLNPWDKQN